MLQLGLVVGIAIFANILGNAFYSHLDLTEEKRFTLSNPTQQMLDSLDKVVYVEVLLEGEFPAGFKRLQRAIQDMLEDFRSESGGMVEYQFTDPNLGTTESVNQRREEYAKQGIVPTMLRIKEGDGTAEKLIYPYALVRYGGRSAVVDLLDEDAPGGQEQKLNYAVSQLEFNFASVLQRLRVGIKEFLAFTVGHDELGELERGELVKELRPFYEVGTFNLDSATYIPQDIKVLIVAKPKSPFSDRDKFLIDQYVMNGGKVIWLIDRLNVELDSMRLSGNYVARDYDLDLDGMLFRYGARVNPDLVLDMTASRIPMVIDPSGTQERFVWPYFPIAVPRTDHPIVKSLDGIDLRFPSSIDTIKTKTPVEKTVLLTTSEYSRLQPNVTRLNFEILRYDLDPDKFDKGPIPLAVLLEGRFPSFFENKVSESMLQGLEEIDQDFKPVSEPTKMIVVSDGDVARSARNPITGERYKLGYNPFEKYRFANKDFLLNAVEYLRDESGIIEARTKEVKLRLLDANRAKEQAGLWQLLNIGVPLLLLGIFGLGYNWQRRRRFGRSAEALKQQA